MTDRKDREAARYVLVQLAERSQDIVSLELAMPDDDASAQAREASEKSMIAKRDSLISMLETSLSQFPTWNNNNALRNSLNKSVSHTCRLKRLLWSLPARLLQST